jgi:hypothetical protein
MARSARARGARPPAASRRERRAPRATAPTRAAPPTLHGARAARTSERAYARGCAPRQPATGAAARARAAAGPAPPPRSPAPARQRRRGRGRGRAPADAPIQRAEGCPPARSRWGRLASSSPISCRRQVDCWDETQLRLPRRPPRRSLRRRVRAATRRGRRTGTRRAGPYRDHPWRPAETPARSRAAPPIRG